LLQEAGVPVDYVAVMMESKKSKPLIIRNLLVHVLLSENAELATT